MIHRFFYVPMMKKNILLLSFSLLLATPALSETTYKKCSKPLTAPFNVISSGLSRDYTQQRVYSFEETGLDKKKLQTLKPKWSFVFDDAIHPRSTPAITDQALFIGSENGEIFALDTETGCAYWKAQAEGEVRTAISIAEVKGKWQIFFSDLKANAYALDALSGKLLWQVKIDAHPDAMGTGSPVYVDGKLLVPVSSLEVANTNNPFFNCCTFRGSVLALDASSGESLWRFYTINESVESQGESVIGVELFGPSGAAVWSPPTVDVKNRRVFIGTGQNYHHPVTAMANAVIAINLDTGKKLWHHKTLVSDAWNSACATALKGPNCPKNRGKDYDFGAPPIYVEGDDFSYVVAGQKSGEVFVFNADNGDLIWRKQVGRGGILGGVHWGMAADKEAVYVPVADTDLMILDNTKGEPKPGLYKLDIKTGKTLWSTAAFPDCTGLLICKHGLSATITVVNGFVLAGGLDGILRAYDAETGKAFWRFDSKQGVTGVNGLNGEGGTIDAAPVVAAKGKLFFNSGYGGFFSVGSKSGNVFWVLE